MSRLRDLRAEYNLTQIQIQMLTGIDQSDYSKIERGYSEPTYSQSVALAQLYHTSREYIVGLTDVREPYPQSKNREAKEK